MDSLVNMTASDPPPTGHESRHLWTNGGITWQSKGAVSALDHGEKLRAVWHVSQFCIRIATSGLRVSYKMSHFASHSSVLRCDGRRGDR
eukprot:COSAG02_NODE_975_length_15507_cov_14.829180_7_plen_89_part_00